MYVELLCCLNRGDFALQFCGLVLRIRVMQRNRVHRSPDQRAPTLPSEGCGLVIENGPTTAFSTAKTTTPKQIMSSYAAGVTWTHHRPKLQSGFTSEECLCVSRASEAFFYLRVSTPFPCVLASLHCDHRTSSFADTASKSEGLLLVFKVINISWWLWFHLIVWRSGL